MKIAGSTAFVTGANRGLGRRFAEQLVARGATVYGGVRNVASLDVPGVIPVAIDVTDPASVTAAAERTSGVSLLINNAGSYTGASVSDGSLEDIRLEMETHYFGTLAVSRAFAPQLAGGGTILNVLSVLSWVTYPGYSGYAAAKSAQWSLTNALRLELAAQGTTVAALHVGYLDTDMVAFVDAPKNDPAVVAALSLDALEEGAVEILADEDARQVQANLAGGVARLYTPAG
ncbi:SDR family oxidoreductase [Microbispora sp. ATCC PTA-5024]|uniref:SDR family oxidoreductase n=1 Tax=Microbispora sp. ATCC PTA-5024 TaxID=316330 RepID=UPI0003DDEF8C|nr:SDR family oxidoreductase [Microbispora sp. ATCC PTA-5024]ETK36812.1 short-chain dehydrogenase [Microbispora sp. ATCC PTA-5024]